MDYFFPGVLALFGCTIVSRFVSEAALKIFSTEEKGRLIEIFSGARKYNLVILLAIFAVLFGAMQYHWINRSLLLYCYFAVLVIYLVVIGRYSYTLLKKNNFPEKYIRKSVTATVIRFGGFAIFLVSMLVSMNRH